MAHTPPTHPFVRSLCEYEGVFLVFSTLYQPFISPLARWFSDKALEPYKVSCTILILIVIVIFVDLFICDHVFIFLSLPPNLYICTRLILSFLTRSFAACHWLHASCAIIVIHAYCVIKPITNDRFNPFFYIFVSPRLAFNRLSAVFLDLISSLIRSEKSIQRLITQ